VVGGAADRRWEGCGKQTFDLPAKGFALKPSLSISRCATACLLVVSPLLGAQEGRQQYVSDVIQLSIREQPSNSAGSIGTVRSGEQVTVLEVLGPESFARIRDRNGREGWVTARYLSDEPAAREQLQAVQRTLAAAEAETQQLRTQLQQAEARLAEAAPALALAGENEALRAAVADAEQQAATVLERYNQQRAERQLLVTGAALLSFGVLLGLLLPWLGRARRRRYGDL
jgi:SH3 domain protein